MIYASFDENNKLIGFYEDRVHINIPENSKIITEQLRTSFLENQYDKTIDYETLQLVDIVIVIDPIKDKTQQDIDTLLVEFNKFPRGVQRQFNDLKNYVISDVNQNKYADALETIQTWLLPQEAEEYRQQFILLLQSIM